MSAVKFRRADGIGVQNVDGRAFLLDASGTEMIVLNPVGTLVWDALETPSDAATIATTLVSQFDDVSSAQLERDVADFLDELQRAGLAVADD
jgi:hypothetical protein